MPESTKSPAEVLGADERLVRKMIRNAFLAGRTLCTSTTGLQDDADAERYAAERDLSALRQASIRGGEG